MKQTCIQFHALNSEVESFIKEVAKKNDLRVYGVIYFPQYSAKELPVEESETWEGCNLIIVCRNEINISDKKLYDAYLQKKCGDLFITLGRDNDMELAESSMGAISDEEIDRLWKNMISRFSRRLLRGAYVVTPTGIQAYYPKHGYTEGAKRAYERGVAIKPVAGWNLYRLEEQ